MGNVFQIQCGDALINRCWGCIAGQPLYVCQLEHNLEALQTARDELREVMNDVMRAVMNEERPEMVQQDRIRGWLSRVDAKITEANGLLSAGAQERQNLCLAGCCSKNFKSSYVLGRNVAKILIDVIALRNDGDFKEVVMKAPANQLQANLEAVKTTKEELRALKADVMQRIALEEGPQKRPLQQVELWVSMAEVAIADADELIRDGSQELAKLRSGDISNYTFVGRVAKKFEDLISLKAKGYFEQVVGGAIAEPDYICKLQDNLEALKTAREELWALKEDVLQRVNLEEGPQKKLLQEVQLWLSMVEAKISEVDFVIRDGPQEIERLRRKDYSNYVFVGRVAKRLQDVGALKAKGGFKEVVWSAQAEPDYASQLEVNLEALKTSSEELRELKEGVIRRVSLEEGPCKKPLNQLQLWLSTVEATLTEVDFLIRHGPKEMERFHLRDFSNYKLLGRVAKKLEDIAALKANGYFKEVVERALPEPAVERNYTPTVGTGTMLKDAWSCLMKEEVGIVGIYGMGGVGKTTLLTQINNKFANTPTNFNVVIWLVVSKDFKYEKMQDLIWKKIGFIDEKWVKKSPDEKAEDIYYVLQRKKFVLLLDDVWHRLDLEEIGIPLPNKKNGSKVVITTRSITVCKQMEAQELIKVKPLNWKEAWELFQNKVGYTDPKILPVAEKVAMECCGLPMALITIGRAMASRHTVEEWEHALEVLRTAASDAQGMEDEVFQDMEVEVFARLKFSYDSLRSNNIKSCFLYCCLFPEDFQIWKHDLVRYWICENFCTSHNEGFSIIGILVRACLLEAGERGYVKLHDVIRDMALWIACKCEKEKENFFVQTGDQVIQFPGDGKWKGARRMSLMANSLQFIPAASDGCQDLLTLFLGHNQDLSAISDGFFQFMNKLTILDLSNTGLLKLPAGISKLTSLQCLNLSSTKISEVPVELKLLAKLKFLNLDHNSRIEMIPRRVIASLSSLEVLKMYKCGYLQSPHFSADNILSLGNAAVYLVDELCCLERLKQLNITTNSAAVLNRIFESQKLLNCMRSLSLTKSHGPRSINISSFAHMKYLYLVDISENSDLEELVAEDSGLHDQPSTPRNNAVILKQKCFDSLYQVIIDSNFKLRELTWLVLAPNLTILTVCHNYNLEEIISAEKLGDDVGGENLDIFPKLQVIKLFGLRKLKSIYQKALSFPSLQSIHVSKCPKLKKLPLNSSSAKGCNVVIEAEEEWWTEVECEDLATKIAFMHCFTSDSSKTIGKTIYFL